MKLSILGQKLRLEVVVISMILGAFIAFNVWCSCSGGIQEGFNAGMNVTGAALDYSLGKGVKVSWENKDELKGPSNYNTWYQHLNANKGGQVPLAEGNLFMFGENTFSPDCCPSTYSSSTGCACASPEQIQYLNERGGNRTLNTNF